MEGKKRLIFSIAGSVAVLLTGCSSHLVNKEFSVQVYNGANSADANNKNTLQVFKEKQRLKDSNYVDVSSNISLKAALAKLGNIDGNIYFLPDNQNFFLPTVSPEASRRLHIDTFRKLNNYIKDTTPYMIEIVKNKFRYGAVKVVNVFNRKEIMFNLKKIPFEITNPTTVSDALQKVCKLTGFNIVYRNDFDNTGGNAFAPANPTNGKPPAGNGPVQNIPATFSNTLPSTLNTQKIFFHGNNVFSFLKYISDMFNVYIDVDYDKKLIIISKYKTKMFHLFAPDYYVGLTSGSTIGQQSNTGSNSNQQTGGQASSSSSSAITSSMKMQVTQQFINAIKNLIANDPNSKVVTDETGDVIVRTTKDNMRTIEEMFEKYNSNFSKQVELTFEVYNFLISKDYKYGIDLNFKNNNTSFITNYITSAIFSQTLGNNDGTIKATSNNNFIQLAKKYTFNTIVINNIPQEISFVDNKDYVKSVETQVTTGTAATTQTVTADIGTITQGQILTVLARVYGNKIFLKTDFKMSNLNSITQEKIGNNTITLPDISNSNIPKTFILRIGEKRIVGYYESYQDASKYNGVVPLKDFIIGGQDNKQYVRVLTVIVVSVDKIKGNGMLYGERPPIVHRITIE